VLNEKQRAGLVDREQQGNTAYAQEIKPDTATDRFARRGYMACTISGSDGQLHLSDGSHAYKGRRTMKLQGGLDVNAVPFTDGMREVAIELMQHARKAIVLSNEAERGARFNNDCDVLWRLESMFDECDFANDPIGTLVAALVDAAKSDFWYSHEKEYDDLARFNDEDYESESDAC
jgi:hypothetical protein